MATTGGAFTITVAPQAPINLVVPAAATNVWFKAAVTGGTDRSFGGGNVASQAAHNIDPGAVNTATSGLSIDVVSEGAQAALTGLAAGVATVTIGAQATANPVEVLWWASD